jgi:hypothetical protein
MQDFPDITLKTRCNTLTGTFRHVVVPNSRRLRTFAMEGTSREWEKIRELDAEKKDLNQRREKSCDAQRVHSNLLLPIEKMRGVEAERAAEIIIRVRILSMR